MLAQSEQFVPAPFVPSPRLRDLVFEKLRRIGHHGIMAAYCRSLDFDPDAWQLEYLCSREKQLALCTGRQSGKSTVMSLRAILTASAGARRDVLIISPTARQSKELFIKAVDFLEHPNAKLPGIVSQSALSLELSNASRLIALPGAPKNIRGFSKIAALFCDEAAFVPSNVFNVISPMLAVSNGDLTAASTCWLPEGFFYDAMERSEDWTKWKVPATENPRISPAFLEKERRAMGDALFEAEYMTTWLPSNTFGVFDLGVIAEAAKDWEGALDWGNFKWEL